MDCPSCALRVEAGARSVDGVRSAAASAVTGALKVVHDGTVRAEDVILAVEAAGYRVRRPAAAGSAHIPAADTSCACVPCDALVASHDDHDHAHAHDHSHADADTDNHFTESVADGAAEFRLRLRLAVAAGAFLAAAFLLQWAGRAGFLGFAPDSPPWAWLPRVPFLVSTVLGGWLVGGQALQAIRSRLINFEVLVVVAAAGAIAIGDLAEAALVVFLFAVGEALEAAGVSRTRRAISSLLDLVPRTALVRRNGSEVEVPASEVAVGETVIIRPGERLPVDGRVLAGESFVNQAPVTGESMPVSKGPGAEVFAGTVNGSGSLEVESTRPPEDTTLARVVHLVEEAQLEKASHQKLVDRFAASYTPVVVALALAVGLLAPLVLGRPFQPYIYRALALLLVACPCAMVLSTPVAVVSAIGNAARHGVLVKGGSALEAAGRVRAVAFDKTGTLTAGRPEVTDVVPAAGVAAGDVLALAAAVESRSEHPLAGAVRRRAVSAGLVMDGANGEAGEPEHFESIPGRGAKARVRGRNHYVGNARLFERDLGLGLGALAEAGVRLEAAGKTVIYVGAGDRVLGLIAVSDVVRDEAGPAMAALRRSGVERLYLLTGDNPATAQAVTEALGLDACRAGLLPQDKVAAVRELSAEAPLAMVGDGINDAPALAASSVGIAMGAAGTDQAIEAADIALMSDDLAQVAYTVRLGRRAVGIIRQNIAVAVGIKLAALALAATGFLPLWLAVMADTGNTVLVILNGLRLLGGAR